MRAIGRSIPFAWWSLRGRVGQTIPVAIAFLLLVCATQMIGMLHNVSSTLTQQSIAHSWRESYDLLVRPQFAVSQPERDAKWIDPQSFLENYGGISTQQAMAISALPHVVRVVPYANVGWQSIDIVVPISLTQKGLYRISAQWNGQEKIEGEVMRYVEVSDLLHLTSEIPVSDPPVQHLILKNDTTPAIFAMSVQATQAIVGIPMLQQASFSRMLLQSSASVQPVHLALHVDMLSGEPNLLPSCIKRSSCWIAQQVQQGRPYYQPDAVQLLRYSPIQYTATSQELITGQVSLQPQGDMQGSLYRLPLAKPISLPDARSFPFQQQGASLQIPTLLPLTAPQRIPLVSAATHFISLEQACAINGANCYSGLYLRLNDVDQYSQRSLAVLQATAAAITARTGLHVDILDGSSLRTISIARPGGNDSALLSTWRVTGVAVQIVHGVDTLQESLLVLCSIVCLLAIGAAGVLVGVGRRKEAFLLQEVGWPRYLLFFAFTLDALIMSLPGSLLSAGWIILTMWLWPTSLSPAIMWLLLGLGIITYGYCLVRMACAAGKVSSLKRKKRAASKFQRLQERWSIVATLTTYLNQIQKSKAFQSKVIAPFICALALVAAIFLIAINWLLISNFNQVLVVTILGKQVRAVLEGPQLALVCLVVSAALLTVGLCTALLLRGRRQELALLSMVGWERRAVLLRILWDSGWPAILSGECGACLALVAVTFTAVPPSLLVAIMLLLAGPFISVLLVSMVTVGLAWQETKRVFIWKW